MEIGLLHESDYLATIFAIHSHALIHIGRNLLFPFLYFSRILEKDEFQMILIWTQMIIALVLRNTKIQKLIIWEPFVWTDHIILFMNSHLFDLMVHNKVSFHPSWLTNTHQGTWLCFLFKITLCSGIQIVSLAMIILLGQIGFRESVIIGQVMKTHGKFEVYKTRNSGANS